jgi:dihydroorotate dehydrogenase
MYKIIIRPLLFLFNPEDIHYFIMHLLKFSFRLPLIKFFARKLYTVNNKKLEIDFLGLKFHNPVGLAAGFDKNAEIYSEMSNLGFSFVEIGTITPQPQPGNEKPRLFRLINDYAMINRMGFNNVGVDLAVLKLKKRNPKIIIGGNIGKNTLTPNDQAINDYEYCFKQLYNYVDYFVVNVSCPNIADLLELQDEDSLTAILNRLVEIRKEQSIKRPVLLKISPDLSFEQVDNMIKIVYKTGIDGFVISNTTIAREGLSISEAEIEQLGSGGLSGNPLKNKSTQIISYVSQNTGGKIPIIGVGGIMSPDDAIEKLKAGASLIQIYTGFIYEGPSFVKKINKKILQMKNTK